MEVPFDEKEFCKIPPLIDSFSENDPSTWQCYSLSKFIDDDGQLTHLISVLWKTPPIFSEIKRMSRQGGWWRSKTIQYFDCKEQKLLSGYARKEFVQRKLKSRLENSLGIEDINIKGIFRSHFNYVCFYPEANLKGFDLHHAIQEILHPYAGDITKCFSDDWERLSWLRGTADYPLMLEPLTRSQHRSIHENLGEDLLSAVYD
mgnify:CR=1 FL=1